MPPGEIEHKPEGGKDNMKPKGIQLSALLMAMLLIGMAFVPAVGARTAQDVSVATSIDCPCSQGVGIAEDSGAK